MEWGACTLTAQGKSAYIHYAFSDPFLKGIRENKVERC